jgi:alpha-1,6-mannosyltransferase
MSVRSPLGATPQSGGFELPSGALGARGSGALRARDGARSSRVGLLGLAGLLVTGGLIVVSAANSETLLPESIRPVPASLAGAFGDAGPNLHSGGAIAALTLMFISYVVAVAASSRLSPRAVLMCIAGLQALVLLAPPLISTDIFSYQAYARIGATYGANPYLSGPHAIALDPVFPYIGAKWSYVPSVYGPVFTVFSYLLAPLSIAASVGIYKSIAALAALGLVAVVWHLARLRGTNQVRAAALVGLNPLLVLYGVGGGHNDLLMLLASVGGIYAILASRERLGGALSVFAVGIKLTAGLLLPFAIAAGGPRRGRRRRRDFLIGAGAMLALIVSASVALYGTGMLDLIATVRWTQSKGDWHSLPGFIVTRLHMPIAGHIVGFVLAAAFLAISVWLLRRVWQGRTDWIDAAGWSTVAMLVAASSLLPWYVAWALPLAAVATDRRLFRAVIVMTGIVLAVQMLGYIPHGGSPFS